MSVHPPQNSGVSHLSVFVLALITILCVVLIGTTGYVKYQLDRSELALAAPDVTFTPEQEVYNKTMRALGYGGFLEASYRVITKRDQAALNDMKMHLKTAQEIVARLNEKTPAGVRHDLEGIVNLYTAIYNKAQQSFENGSIAFTPGDLSPALAALPFFDMRLQAAIAQNRIKAQDSYRFWGLSLTLIAWCSLLLAAAMSAGIYLAYRNRQAAPLRALAQSIKNLARGDMTTPIWGMNRNDAIGELSRAVDLARYHFSQLPDLSLMSDQGPVRLKFEGDTRSIFEAMMRNIAEEFEKTRKESSGYARDLGSLQESLSTLAYNLNTVISQIQTNDTGSHQALQQLVHRLDLTAQSLTNVNDRATGQLNKLVPYLQERAHSMAEVTSIAGSQIAQSLEKLMKLEETMRDNAAQSRETGEKFAENTNQLSERLFASANLLQASSTMLSETTDTVQSRFNEAVESLSRGENHLKEIMGQVEERLNHTAKAEANMAEFATRAETNLGRMEGSMNAMSTRHEQLSEQFIGATQRMESVVASFDSAQRAMSDAMQFVKRDGDMLSALLQELRSNNEHLLTGISQNSQAGYAVVQTLAERSQKIMQQLEGHLAEQGRLTETRVGELVANTNTLNQQVLTATSALTQTVSAMREEHERFATARSTFSDSVNKLGARLEQQTTTTLTKTEEWASQNFGKLSSLTDEMQELMQRLGILNQLTGTLGAVAGQLGQIVPALANGKSPGQNGSANDPALESIVEELGAQLTSQWNEAMGHIGAMHDQLAQMIERQKDQLETRLMVMDKKLRAVSEQGLDPTQMSFMNEIVEMLAKISEHVIMLDESINGRNQQRKA